MSKTAIVIGATGVVGKALVDKLVAEAGIAKVVTLTRKIAPHDSSKVENHVLEFEHLADHAELFRGDMLFSCLGTTRKQAGSLQAQRKVDVDYQFNAAKLALAQGVSQYLLVSSSGANAQSAQGYLRMKGELEQQVQQLNFSSISVFQPSLLLGHRSEFRFAEVLGQYLLPLMTRLPRWRRYRPIKPEQVAEKMCQVSLLAEQGIHFFSLDQIFIE